MTSMRNVGVIEVDSIQHRLRRRRKPCSWSRDRQVRARSRLSYANLEWLRLTNELKPGTGLHTHYSTRRHAFRTLVECWQMMAQIRAPMQRRSNYGKNIRCQYLGRYWVWRGRGSGAKLIEGPCSLLAIVSVRPTKRTNECVRLSVQIEFDTIQPEHFRHVLL